MKPWVDNLLHNLFSVSLKEVMLGTAMMDIAIGFLLLVEFWVWPVALVGAVHLGVVMMTSGIDPITVRDIGLLAAMIALFVSAYKFYKIKRNIS